MKQKIKLTLTSNTTVKLTDEEVVKTAKKICVDLPITLGEYVTEAVKEKNLKNKKPV